MGSDERGWTGAEAWIFLSIGDAAGTGGAPLDKVIAAADSNNHAIPTVDEFSSAVGQLVGAGLVIGSPDRYSLTEAGEKLFKEINSVRRGHITRFLDTLDKWRTRPPSRAAAVAWVVDPQQFHRAWELYHKWFEAWFARHKKRDRNDRSL
ncbi:hypothetical protein EPN29_13130 [bacterium]|nr:MAG: hypothetical protein EPN29_13130 [bacterium]